VNAIGPDHEIGVQCGFQSRLADGDFSRWHRANDLGAEPLSNPWLLRDGVEQHALERRPPDHYGAGRLTSRREQRASQRVNDPYFRHRPGHGQRPPHA
jgi:hypothetical protein